MPEAMVEGGAITQEEASAPGWIEAIRRRATSSTTITGSQPAPALALLTGAATRVAAASRLPPLPTDHHVSSSVPEVDWIRRRNNNQQTQGGSAKQQPVPKQPAPSQPTKHLPTTTKSPTATPTWPTESPVKVDLYYLAPNPLHPKSLNIGTANDTGHHPKRRSLFQLCTSLHRSLSVQRVLLLAPEVQFYADVSLLWAQFELFPARAVFGLAREQSPRYARALRHQRGAAPKQGGCGDPPTVGGNPGLNSAVALLDLDAMRRSPEYNRLYSTLDDMVNAYGWYGGPLADNDFYTIASCRTPALLHLLPCAWNRQVPTSNKAPVASSSGEARDGGLYRWCEGGVYACSAHCPEY
ncbi:xyloside xylosyltransferase 1-like [Dermacentor silvarum]|uniref:xyloside xylosyltransferase 1-like n=1 Tax=Dermacentor silvarum TaxID=543639 RepID=UPI0021010965|nr:xyloside xylosyltransferase 1-like [Dermacentor silvarum]